jgi:hypothetical protein
MNETPKIAAVIDIRWCIGLHISKVTSAQRRNCRLKLTRKAHPYGNGKTTQWHRTDWVLLLLRHNASEVGRCYVLWYELVWTVTAGARRTQWLLWEYSFKVTLLYIFKTRIPLHVNGAEPVSITTALHRLDGQIC